MLIYWQKGDVMDNLSMYLGSNVVVLRKKQGLSQSQLAQKANIPRSTLTYIESGEGNPSLSNLVKVSNALQVSVEELLSKPHESTKLTRANEIRVMEKSGGQVLVEKLLPEPIPGMEIDKMNLAPGARMKGTPHIARTREYCYCETGKINIYVSRKKHELSAGDVLSFPGDEPHAYENANTSKKASCFSVVVFAPQGI